MNSSSQKNARPKLIDISPVLSARIGVFPGDVGFSRDVALDFEKGHHLTLSSIRTSVHVGAHTDAPNHYHPKGEGIATRDPWIYMGPCLVLEAKATRGERVGRQHLAPQWRETLKWPAPRILVRTESFPDPDHWNSDFCSFDPVLIEDWARAGVKLIGIDTPSIDPETDQTMASHKVVARNDLAILEGVVLSEAPEGLYTLIALPLPIEDADASPVRAILLDDSQLFA